jgi:hypothetical protein
MSSKKNPIEEIYKCSILKRHQSIAGGVPSHILVFYGTSGSFVEETGSSQISSESLTRLYNAYIEDGSNSKMFEDIFSKMELRNIATYDIQVHMVPFKIYSDDSVDVIKRKIMLAIKSVPDLLESGYAYDELFLFSKTPVIFDSNEVYHKMTEFAKDEEERKHDLEFLKTYLMGYSSSMGEAPPSTDGNILSTLNQYNGKNMFKDVPIGQSMNANLFVNPFFNRRIENVELSKIKSKARPLELLLHTKNIVHNTLFACFARDVMDSEVESESKSILSDNENAIVLKAYFPLLYSEGIQSLSEFESESTKIKLREKTDELIDSKEFQTNMKQIQLFYDIFEKSTKPRLKSEEAGIIEINIELLPESDFNFPLELLFKLFHATEECQVIKYTPQFQDAILRM